MHSRRSPILLALAGATLALVGAGCHGNPPVIDLEDEFVAFIPLKERTLGHFESRLGHEIADAAIGHVQTQAADMLRVIGAEEIYDLFEIYEDPSKEPPEKIAEKLGAEVYALGEIREWRYRDPGSINLSRGTAKIHLEVWRRAPKRLIWSGVVEANYPEAYGTEYGRIFVADEDIRDGLIAVTGRNIARKFYDYDDPGR